MKNTKNMKKNRPSTTRSIEYARFNLQSIAEKAKLIAAV